VTTGENGTGEGNGMPPPDGGLEDVQFASGQISNIPTMQSVADMTGMSGEPCPSLISWPSQPSRVA
jgi:hypothetical protein